RNCGWRCGRTRSTVRGADLRRVHESSPITRTRLDFGPSPTRLDLHCRSSYRSWICRTGLPLRARIGMLSAAKVDFPHSCGPQTSGESRPVGSILILVGHLASPRQLPLDLQLEG